MKNVTRGRAAFEFLRLLCILVKALYIESIIQTKTSLITFKMKTMVKVKGEKKSSL